MKTWPTKKLGEVCEIKGGNAAPQDKSFFQKGTIPFVRMQDLGRYHITTNLNETVNRVTEEAIKKFRLQIWPKGSILIPRSGSVYMNHRAILGTNACVVSHIAILTNFNKELLAKYLFYYLSILDIGRLGTKTTGIDSISFGQIERLKIPLPLLTIQRQIVSRLDAIRKVQELNDKQIALADELFQSLLYKELDSRRKNWEVKRLGDLCEKIEQSHPRKKFKNKFKYIDISSIDSNTKNIQNTDLIDVDKAPSRARKLVKAKDVLFATTRPYLKHIALVPEGLDNSVCSTGFCVIRAKNNLTIPEFLYFTVIEKLFIRKILVFQRGASYPAVSDKDIYNRKIFLPSLKTQRQIAEKLLAAQDYKKKLLEQKQKLQELFASYLDKAMKGDL